MICTSKNTYSFEDEEDKQYFNVNIVECLIGPTNKRYNYFSIISNYNVDYVSYNENIYSPNHEIKVKIENMDDEIVIEKNNKTIRSSVTIFFGYSEEVEFEP